MKKVVLFITALVLSVGTCSQTAGRRASDEVPFEVKRSVFFADMRLDEYSTSEWDSAYKFLIKEKRFSASGGLLEQFEYAINQDRGIVVTKMTTDSESRLKNRVVYQYNEKSNLITERLLDSKAKVISSYEFTYDNNGHLISRVIKDRSGIKMAETTYTVDVNGRRLTSVTRDLSQNAISSTQFSYNSQGQLIKEEVTNAEGRLTSSTVYEWQDGNEVKNELRSADNTVQMRITSEYGNRGELNKKTIDNFQGESKQIMQYEYVFRRQG